MSGSPSLCCNGAAVCAAAAGVVMAALGAAFGCYKELGLGATIVVSGICGCIGSGLSLGVCGVFMSENNGDKTNPGQVEEDLLYKA